MFPVGGGQTLNGAFTVWIRRPLHGRRTPASTRDDTRPDAVVIVAEGIAPYFGPGDAFTRARQATRVLETRFTLEMRDGRRALPRRPGRAGGRLADGRELQPLRAHHGRRDGQSGERVRRCRAAGTLGGTGVQ